MRFQTDILPYLQNYKLCVQLSKNLALTARNWIPSTKRDEKIKDGSGWKSQKKSKTKTLNLLVVNKSNKQTRLQTGIARNAQRNFRPIPAKTRESLA